MQPEGHKVASNLPRPHYTGELQPRATELFVNRDTPIAIFKDAVASISPEQAHQVLTFYGVGGQGKTHLCRHFSGMLSADPSKIGPNLRWGAVDLHQRIERQSEFILLWVRNALKKSSKVSFPAFDYAFELFWKETYGSQPLPVIENPWWEEVREHSSSMVADGVPLVLDHVPFLGSILGRLARHALDYGRDEILRRSNRTLKHLYPLGKLLPAHEIKSRLAFILARDLDDWRTDHPADRFVILVDEYESALEAGGASRLFNENHFDETARELVAQCRATLFVFFSREKLRWESADPAWGGVLDSRQHLLGGLSKGDAERFLTLAGVYDEEVRAAMTEGAAARDPTFDAVTCYPIMLDMQVELFRGLTAAAVPVTADHFQIDGENFAAKRHELLSRLLRRYPSPLQATLRRLSVARRFDESVYTYLIAEFHTGQPADEWNAVQALSLVQRGAIEGIHTFHNVVRESLLATLEPEATKATHKALFEYFQRIMAPRSGEQIGDAQASAAAEAFYHIKAVEPLAACTWWVESGTAFRGAAIERFVEDIDRANAALAAKVFGEKSVGHAQRVFQLGQNLDFQSRYFEAESLYRQALMILNEIGAGDTLTAADVLMSLGVALDFQKKHLDAEPFLLKAIDIKQTILESSDHQIAMNLAAVGTNLNHQGRYAEAEQLIRKALDIVGEDDRSAGTIFQNLGLCLGSQGRLPEAEEMHRKGLAVRERLFGPDHHRTGTSLGYLGLILDKQKQHSLAEPLLRRALAIAEASFGLDHPETANSFRHLGRILYNLGRFKEAEQSYRQELAIRERISGPAHSDTAASVANLGLALYRSGNNEEAVIYLRRAFEIRETVLGRDDPETRVTARQLGEALTALGRASVADSGRDVLAP